MNHSIHNDRPTVFRKESMGAYVLLACLCLAGVSPAAFAADKPKGPEISRVISKEMTAAQKAMQASQWSEALKNLEAAETKSPLTAFDKKTIYDFKGFVNIKLNNLKAAEAAYETAIGVQGGYTPEESAKTYRMLFRLAAGNQNYAKAVEYGSRIHPQYRQEFENGVAVAWHRVPSAMGCFGLWTDDTRAEHYDNLCAFDGRIVLAGEHASYLPAWQEGAVTSSLDAIGRLHRRALAAAGAA